MTTPRRHHLTDAWAVLSPPDNPGDMSTSPLPIVFAGAPARAGVDGLGGRHLLVPASAGDDPRADDTAGAVTVRIAPYGFAGRRARYLDIACHRTDLFDLFDDLALDVLTGIPPGDPDPASAAATLVRRWRSLLSTGPRRVLGASEQIALLGELHVLDLVHPAGPVDITCWRGPRREPHDIVLPDRVVEVKTLAPDAETVRIHGIEQLQPPGTPLALVLLTVTQDGTDGITLPDVVDRILDRATDRAETLRRLADAGYGPTDRDNYPARYTVQTVEHVLVDDRTPRIVHSCFPTGSLPDGITHIDYRVRLGALRHSATPGVTALRTWAGTE